MKMNQLYFSLCRAVQYKNIGAVDMLFFETRYKNLWDGNQKHLRWFMKFLRKNGLTFGDK